MHWSLGTCDTEPEQPRDGCRSLWTAVVLRAVSDLRFVRYQGSSAWWQRRLRLGEDARSWLFDPWHEADLAEVCRLADLDVETVRRVALDYQGGRFAVHTHGRR